jgi:hypothetical protein
MNWIVPFVVIAIFTSGQRLLYQCIFAQPLTNDELVFCLIEVRHCHINSYESLNIEKNIRCHVIV